jgi:hypothetical protein
MIPSILDRILDHKCKTRHGPEIAELAASLEAFLQFPFLQLRKLRCHTISCDMTN